MKDDAVIKDNEAVYLLNEQTYLHLRENLAGVGYEVFDKNSPLPVEEGQIPREALGNTQRRIETARAYYLAEHQDEPVGKIQNVAVTTLEKFRSGVRKRRNLAPRSLPENDVRFIDPMYNELFRVPDGGVVQMTYPDGHQRSEKVEYLDDYHMKIGSSVTHIGELAERMARSRAIVEPEPLTQQDCRAWNLEYDYSAAFRTVSKLCAAPILPANIRLIVSFEAVECSTLSNWDDAYCGKYLIFRSSTPCC